MAYLDSHGLNTLWSKIKTWVGAQGYLTSHQDISGKENISNKVTSVSSSSTDTQYPTAKCLYDMCGDIEALLEDLL